MDPQQLDAFPLLVGLIAIVGGPLFLATGESTGWCLLLVAVGIVLVAVHHVAEARIEFEPFTLGAIITVTIGLACVWVAAIYLSRAADDLPRLFPGHSSNSEHYRLMHGMITVVVGTALVIRAALRTRVTRPDGHGGDAPLSDCQSR